MSLFRVPEIYEARILVSPIFPIQTWLDQRSNTVVVPLRDRIVAMVMALGAADGQSEERARYDLDRLGDHIVSSDVRLDSLMSCPVGSVSEETCGR